ncbi:MAG: response regulator transcription factor [Anaerolineales bacterium]|nr:response regulator transcription factor [Anaerolineales bacterium]
MTATNIKVAILEDHQSVVDGYLYRLSAEPKIQVIATIFFGEELEPMLAQHQVDVLLLDVQVPTSASNPNPYPILHAVSALMQSQPNINILAISMHTSVVLIQSLIDAGVSGYIYKDDYASIRQIARIILTVANGGIYFSEAAYQQLRQGRSGTTHPFLSPRQIEALSLCASYPDDSTAELAERLDVANSTLRNLLSNAYVRLGVHTRAAALAKVQKMGLFSDSTPPE